MISDRITGNDRGDDRTDDDGRKLCDRKIANDDFCGEDRTRDGCVEGRGDACRCTAADEGSYARCVQTEFLTDRRSERRSDLYDRALAANRSARSDRDRGGERLDPDDSRADDTAANRDGLHDFGNAVTSRFTSEEIDERADGQSARRGNRDSPIPAQLSRGIERIVGLGGNPFVDQQCQRVGSLEGKCLDSANQQSEEDGAQCAGKPDDDRGDDHE